MSIVTRIEANEYPGRRERRSRAEEFDAVRGLRPNEAIRFPCRWSHSKPPSIACSGAGGAYSAVKNKGFKISATCREGTIYVIRREA
jgi:hypothetical protein